MGEKEMATHSSSLSWRILGMEEPGGLPSMGSYRVGHDWSDLAAAAAQGKGVCEDSEVGRTMVIYIMQEAGLTVLFWAWKNGDKSMSRGLAGEHQGPDHAGSWEVRTSLCGFIDTVPY